MPTERRTTPLGDTYMRRTAEYTRTEPTSPHDVAKKLSDWSTGYAWRTNDTIESYHVQIHYERSQDELWAFLHAYEWAKDNNFYMGYVHLDTIDRIITTKFIKIHHIYTNNNSLHHEQRVYIQPTVPTYWRRQE